MRSSNSSLRASSLIRVVGFGFLIACTPAVMDVVDSSVQDAAPDHHVRTTVIVTADGVEVPIPEAAQTLDWSPIQSLSSGSPSPAVLQAADDLEMALSPSELEHVRSFDWTTATVDGLLADPIMVRALAVFVPPQTAAAGRVRWIAHASAAGTISVIPAIVEGALIAVAAPAAGYAGLALANPYWAAAGTLLVMSAAAYAGEPRPGDRAVFVPDCGANDACPAATECAAGTCVPLQDAGVPDFGPPDAGAPDFGPP